MPSMTTACLQAPGTAMEELALEAERTNCMMTGGVRLPARLCECAIKGAEGV
jgi:hypothetical protein